MIEEFGGLAKVMPVYAAVFLVVTMASIGVPGTNGFVGEFLVIMGTYTSKNLASFAGMQAVAAAFGVILAAVYMLSMVQKVFFGPLSNPKNRGLEDLNTRETLALAPLVIMIFLCFIRIVSFWLVNGFDRHFQFLALFRPIILCQHPFHQQGGIS